MRPALCYSICVMRSCVVASCPFNVELPARILHNTLSLPLASTVLSMNVHKQTSRYLVMELDSFGQSGLEFTTSINENS